MFDHLKCHCGHYRMVHSARDGECRLCPCYDYSWWLRVKLRLR